MRKMNDEPMLCFDGDGAGRRAAYRAIDIALPLIKPGKSLKFAGLPDGQDPDDLARSGGRDAIADVLGSAQPLAQMLWQRESEQGPFDTPERRAALEARINEVTQTIADETVRRYYRQDFTTRLRTHFAPVNITTRRPAARDQRYDNRPGFAGRLTGAPARPPGPRASFARNENNHVANNYVAVSPQLAASSLHRGPRAAIPRSEALMLQAAVNHPWLLHDHMEELAEAEFRNPDTQRLKGALIDVFAHHVAGDFAHDGGHSTEGDHAALVAELERAGFGETLRRIERSITTLSVWGARPEAAPDDVLLTWRQLVALHRQWHSLSRELKDAELALGQDNSEANYSRLLDVKARLSSLDGTEALVEGFGAQSGRPTRSF
jgi:DNA primase